jgi:hypothetical protein
MVGGGRLALRRSAFKEAIAHLGKAIPSEQANCPRDAEGEAGRELSASLYGTALMAARG